jgi:hypothetical protein
MHNDTGIFDGLSAQDVKRTSMLDDLFIPHPRALFIQARSERLYREAKLRPGKPGEAVMFVGPSGIGKSEALQMFCCTINDAEFEAKGLKRGDRITNQDGLSKSEYIPVLYVSVPEVANLKDFYSEILVCLGEENPRGTVSSMRPRLVKAIKNAGVELIVIDELQHLVDTENDRVKRNVANAIKRLLDVLKLPMVLAGMDESKRIFGPSLETKRRTDWCFDIRPYDRRSDEDSNAFNQFLVQYDAALVERGCFKKLSCLSDPTRAARIHYAARGAVGHVGRLIKAAGTIAIEARFPFIADEHLAAACDAIFLDPFLKEIEVNPFRTGELPAFQYLAGEAPKAPKLQVSKRRANKKKTESELHPA